MKICQLAMPVVIGTVVLSGALVSGCRRGESEASPVKATPTFSVSTESTASEIARLYENKGIRPRIAKFYRVWED